MPTAFQRRFPFRRLPVALLLLTCWAGCGGPPAGSSAPLAGDSVPAGRTTNRQAAATAPAEAEYWDAIYSQGAKIGHAHTRITRHEADRGPVRRVRYESHLRVRRFGDTSAPSVEIVTEETPAGQVLSFHSDVRLSAAPRRAEGQVRNGRMEIETTSAGKTVKATLPWSDDIRGINAVEDELTRQPMQPGERRALKAFNPLLGQVSDVQLAAGRFETVPLLGGATEKLLRIEGIEAAPAIGEFRYTLWVDERGAIRKKRTVAAGGQEEFRTTREVATASEGPPLDLGFSSVVRLKRPLNRPHETRQVRYRVRLENDDPRRAFAAGPAQQIETIDARTARLTVRALRPPAQAPPPVVGPSAAADSPPTDEDRRPNGLVQSDDPRVIAMAGQVAQGESDAWRVAVALEGLVHRAVTEKNYESAAASAAEVARTLEGDCTEHAVLLAALARARGIPARVVIGLVYSPGLEGFAFHMWNEVHARGGWYALDATLGRGGIGAAHLKLMDSSLSDGAGMAGFLKVAQVMGQLRIEVQDVRH